MKTPNTIEEDLNRIRLAIYEETKDMTPEQCVERRIRNTEALAREYGYRLVPNNDNLNSMRLVRITEAPETFVPVAD